MLIQLAYAALGALGCAVAVVLLTAPVRGWLLRAGVHDAPNARSSHTVVKPRGGGLAVLGVVLPAWLAAGWFAGGPVPLALAALTAALAAVSFLDDLSGLQPALRFLAQAAAVAAALVVLDPAPLFPELVPLWLEQAAVALAWLWFVNLYNFMDGIDGITAVETACVAVGVGLCWLLLGAGVTAALPAWLLAGAAVGFLWWNWAPSRIFLGDVGSVPIGFAVGWLLLELAAGGALVAAIILPAYYLVDATVTLLARLLRGEKVWQAHKQHAYQRAVQRGRSHATVAVRVAMANLVLVGCAAWAVSGTSLAAALVAAVVAGGLWASLRFGLADRARA
jgi:UDP-N-acetylmuramyl pentapeptide phosphotransferase/UDP-N-acetylglucosamine-1-phosphate transferase